MLENWLPKLIHDWTLRKGLLVAPMLFFVICTVSVSAQVSGAARYCLAGAGIAMYLLFWLFARYVPPMFGRRYCVAVCLAADEESEDTVRKIIRQLRTRLDECNTRRPITIKVLPGDLIGDRRGAKRYSRWTGVPVVIWGSYERQTHKGAEICRAPSCYFEVQFVARVLNHRTMDKYVSSLEHIIQPIMSSGIRLSETSIDVPKEVEGYVQTVTGLLAPILLEAGDPLLCALLAESLLKRLRGNDSSSRYLRALIVLSLVCHLEWNGSRSPEERLKLLERLWRYPEGHHYAMAMNIARVAWEAGDCAAAERYTEEIERLDPGRACYAFNKAFLSLCRQEYDTSAGWYAEAHCRYRSREDNMSLTDIVMFLAEQKCLHPDEIGYDFAVGVANCAGLDETLGVDDLRAFCSRAAANPKYAAMVQCAKRIMGEHAFPLTESPGTGARQSRKSRRMKMP